MVTQDTIFEAFLAEPELTKAPVPARRIWYQAGPFLILHGPEESGLHVVVGKDEYSRYCGEVARNGKPYPHVEKQFRESICSCTGTFPIHGVKSWQRASGSSASIRTPRFLPVTPGVTISGKNICSNGTSTSRISDYRARARAKRFLRNRNQKDTFRDHQSESSNNSALLAWLKQAIALSRVTIKTRTSAGAVTAFTIREILLRRLKGFQTKKFT